MIKNGDEDVFLFKLLITCCNTARSFGLCALFLLLNVSINLAEVMHEVIQKCYYNDQFFANMPCCSQ